MTIIYLQWVGASLAFWGMWNLDFSWDMNPKNQMGNHRDVVGMLLGIFQWYFYGIEHDITNNMFGAFSIVWYVFDWRGTFARKCRETVGLGASNPWWGRAHRRLRMTARERCSSAPHLEFKSIWQEVWTGVDMKFMWRNGDIMELTRWIWLGHEWIYS